MHATHSKQCAHAGTHTDRQAEKHTQSTCTRTKGIQWYDHNTKDFVVVFTECLGSLYIVTQAIAATCTVCLRVGYCGKDEDRNEWS